MSRTKAVSVAIVCGLTLLGLASLASADEVLPDGSYTLVVPGVGDFQFDIASTDNGQTTVTTMAVAPTGYEIQDNEADEDNEQDEDEWENLARLEVEAKTDEIEADIDWDRVPGEPVMFKLPGVGSITIVRSSDGVFTVTAPAGWFVFKSGGGWFVTDKDSLDAATVLFKVEADDGGIEIKLADATDVEDDSDDDDEFKVVDVTDIQDDSDDGENDHDKGDDDKEFDNDGEDDGDDDDKGDGDDKGDDE